MLFNSIQFLIFFPIVVLVYFLLPHRFRWILLLISSYYFYMSWKAEYIILIIISTLVDYTAGLQIHKSKSHSRKKYFLLLSILTNLGLLFAFKYFNFFSDSLRALLSSLSIQLNPMTLKVLLPVGISFYTFQTLSYTIDVYRGKIKPEKHLGIFAVYVSFFPQLVAGPIERAKNLLPQFYKKYYFDYKRTTDGIKLMLWGFFKKVVIADRLAYFVNLAYSNPGDYTGLTLLLATVFFAFQIYCDFSGYSDIAIGAAQIMGYSLMDNFKRPYFSKSISEFWKRWHISLSTWFRDYLYIPIGGNRVSIPRWYLNLLIVFVVSGLWHGANWTFVVWGGLHGFYMLYEVATQKLRDRIARGLRLDKVVWLRQGLQMLVVFILVNIGWIFFRANSLSDAIHILQVIFTETSFNFTELNLFISAGELLLCIALIGFMEFVHVIQEHRSIRHFMSDKPLLLRWSVYALLIMMILLLGVFNQTEFIYFQF
ncbi:MBOAT family protein [Candidatus Woesearchaeota archaeon]|nr:MBOAT family protein [Candidatus Woesearchaeota archaeon]